MARVGIYKITSPSGKVYIGQSVNINDRFNHYRHMGNAIKKQRKLYASLAKYGWATHVAEIIHELPKDVDREILNIYETLYINQFISCGVELLNIKEGGSNGRHSEETKEKIKANGRKGVKVSEETRAKMRAVSIGRPSHMKGKKHSNESRLKMKESQIKRDRSNIVYTEEQMEAKRQSALRMVAKRKWIKHPMLGKHHTEESKEKNRQKKLGKPSGAERKVKCSKTGVIFDSIKKAAESIGMQPNTLRMQMRGINTNRTTFCFLTSKT